MHGLRPTHVAATGGQQEALQFLLQPFVKHASGQWYRFEVVQNAPAVPFAYDHFMLSEQEGL